MAKPPKKLSPAEIEAEVKRLLEPKIDLPAPTVIINKRITNEFTETGGSSIQFKDEGVNQGTPASIENVDFVGAGVTAVAAGNTLTVTIPGSAGGEANTASNVGAGEGVFKQKTGVDLEFKSLDSIDARIVIGSTADEVTFDFDATGLATETYVDDAIDDHEAAVDPHPQYLTQAEADALYSVLAHTHTTTDVAEGTNLYFTTERAQDAVGLNLIDSSTIDFTYDDTLGTFTAATIPAGILAQLLTVDGAGSGLDADLLDGLSSAAFALASHNHSAADITSGLLALARGGTNADLSATGGTSFVLRQSSAGAAITVSQLAPTELTGWPANAVGTLTNDGAGNLSWVAGGGGYTDEMAQDAVGTILIDSATIDFTYDDGLNTITAATIPAGILAQLLTVDGAGSGLDADLLDGISSAAFGLVANPLSQFAATTSAQLRGVLSDENGTGVAIFDSSTSQTLITPIIASFTTAQHDHTNAAGGGTIAHSALTGLTTGDPHTQYLLIDGTRAMTGILDLATAGIRAPASSQFNLFSRENNNASAQAFYFESTNKIDTVGGRVFAIYNTSLSPVYTAEVVTGVAMKHTFSDGGVSGNTMEFRTNTSFPDFILNMDTQSGTTHMNLRQSGSDSNIEITHGFLNLTLQHGSTPDMVTLFHAAGVKGMAPGTNGAWDLGVAGAEWRDCWVNRKLVVPDVYGGDGSGEHLDLFTTTHATKGLIRFGGSSSYFFDETENILSLGQSTPTAEVFETLYASTVTGGTADQAHRLAMTVNPASNHTAESSLLDISISTASTSTQKASNMFAQRIEAARGATDSSTLTNLFGLQIQAGNAAWSAGSAGNTDGAVSSNILGIKLQLNDTSSTTVGAAEYIGIDIEHWSQGVGSTSRTITDFYGIKIDQIALTSTNKTVYTNFTPLKIVTDNSGGSWRGTITNAISIDVNAWSAGANVTYTNPPEQLRLRAMTNANSIAIRQQGATPHNRFQGFCTIGADSAPDTALHLKGTDAVATFDEVTNDPAQPTSANQMRVYMKNNKFVIQYNDAGTTRYVSIVLSGTGVTWVHSTTAP